MSDPVDIRVMGPRVRRAMAGAASGEPADLTDDAIKDATADACADILLYTGSLFGKQLLITARDDDTGAPEEYATSEELALDEQSVVAAQAALTHFFYVAAAMKVSERIGDEASFAEWTRSATLLRDGLALLQKMRDDALAALERRNVALDGYVSFLAVRDREVAALIEPYTAGVGGGAGLEVDFRFG